MGEAEQQSRLRKALNTLESLGVVPQAAAVLSPQEVMETLRDVVVAEIPAFSTSGNPHVLPGAAAHSADHVKELTRLWSGGAVGNLDFVRVHARHRAEQKFPLEAVLGAYRIGLRVLQQWMRDAALETVPDNAERVVSAVADFAIEYADIISNIATSEYVAQTRLISEAESDRRTELLGILLSGYDESDGRVARLLRRAGYLEQRKTFCVTVAQSRDPKEMDHPARAQRVADALAGAVANAPIRALVGIRENMAVAVYSDTRRQSGWTAPRTLLAERLYEPLYDIGPFLFVGVSSDAPSTSFIPKAFEEAKSALDFASDKNRLVLIAKVPVRELVLRVARDHVQSSLPPWIDDYLQADDRARRALTQTLRAYADNDMNVSKAAKKLGVHPNTIYNRFERIGDLTGLDALRFNGLTELLLAADCRREWWTSERREAR